MSAQAPLTAKEQVALNEVELTMGRYWKAALRTWWANGAYPTWTDAATLQQLRNNRGPTWLADYRHDFKRGTPDRR
jgi:hypothetical protein